ncbi:hypothetical protein [Bacillus andreraoultii]|uniref:hypothetical protein n=1 Tax=Bacillus andreraoultii TaxID=1499685 RepID=UPI00053B3509|nr:hypothetical protein [Bacillus andreraoultii]
MKPNLEKQFQALDQKSTDVFHSLELSLKQLKSRNEELAKVYETIEAEIIRLKQLRLDINNRIAMNENAINTIDSLLKQSVA